MSKLNINIQIAVCGGKHYDTALKRWKTNWAGLKKRLSEPTIGAKDGPYFIRCTGTIRSNAETASEASILILDGDSRIIDTEVNPVPGAPDPELVCQVLSKLGLTYLFYTSHSNHASSEELAAKNINSGGLSGADFHKYRVIIPCRYIPEQLPILLEFLFSELHAANVMLTPVKENRAWSQPWFFPRLP
jgi:hypothetical protein